MPTRAKSRRSQKHMMMGRHRLMEFKQEEGGGRTEDERWQNWTALKDQGAVL